MVRLRPLQPRWSSAIPRSPSRSLAAATLGGVALGTLLLGGCSSLQAELGLGKNRPTASAYPTRLAQHLTNTNSVMYGAYWCPHCADQKAMFEGAAEQIPYVECAAAGHNAQPELCRQEGVEGYPTWKIDGQLYPGVRSLEELASLSRFSPP